MKVNRRGKDGRKKKLEENGEVIVYGECEKNERQ